MTEGTGPLRILLVEDSQSDAKLVAHHLMRAYGEVLIERVDDEASMRRLLDDLRFDAIISDWSIPGFGGLAALGVVKELRCDIPFIIVSGTVGETAAVEAMRTGAHDYLLKDNLTRLAPVLDREMGQFKVRQEGRKAESALRESRTIQSMLFENSPIPSYFFDAVSLNFSEVNEAALGLYGYGREEFLGMTLLGLRAEDEVPASLRPEAPPREDWSGMARHRTRDGRILTVEITSRSMTFAEREGRLAVVRDVTRQLQLEEQLRQAQKMEAIGRLAGGVAHDFNNLLSVILSYSELALIDLPIGEPLRDDIEEIGKAGRRASHLTKQLLMFSRQQVLEPRILDLNELLASSENMLRRILGEDIEMTLVPGVALGTVKADAGSIEQVVMNLVVNARDAMPTGGQLTIETANADIEAFPSSDASQDGESGAFVMLAVTDTGTGMDKATQARIFEPFFTTKDKGKGTGLGLSTVFGIVEQSRGRVWVYSEPGQGTVFKVYLPRVDGPVEVRRPAPVDGLPRGFETVLLVEDEEQVRAVVRGILKRYGYQVIEALDAGDAVLKCEAHNGVIHLLLSDVVMPQMSGPVLAKRLAQLRPAMLVLYMSGYTDDSIVRHGLLESGIAFLQKPVTPESLVRKVRAVLDDTPN